MRTPLTGLRVRPRRALPRAAAAVLCAAALVTAAACSSDSGSSTSGGTSASGQSASSTAANVAAAKTAIAPYTGHPSAFPVNEPLPKPLPPGTTFAYLQCSSTVCGLVGKMLQPAVATIGGTLKTVNAGATAQSSQAAADSVLAMKPDIVLLSGVEPSLFGGSLKALSDAGITVVSLSISKDVRPYGITFNYIGAEETERDGALMADWVIANKGPHADIAFYGVPEIEFSGHMQQAFQQEVAKNCPSCTVRTIPVGIATLGSTSARTVVADLQAHPKTDAAVFASAEVASGLPAAMRAAGLSVTTLGYAPTPATLQDIKDGGITGGLAVDLPVSIWAGVDAAARIREGGHPTPAEQAGSVPTQFLEKQDITFDPTLGWTGYPDYQQRFATLWHVNR